MRIVAVADTHTFQDDLGALPEGDVFIHAGDLCRGGRLEELRVVAAWLQGLPHPHKIVVAGNHDSTRRDSCGRLAAEPLREPGVHGAGRHRPAVFIL